MKTTIPFLLLCLSSVLGFCFAAFSLTSCSDLVVCYNRQANDDKNEIAIRTEGFINERVTQIN